VADSSSLLIFLALFALGSGKRRKAVPPVTPPQGHINYTRAELVTLTASIGFPDPALAAAVAMAESGGNPYAVGDGGTSFGLWQIHMPAHPEFDASKLLEPNYNAHAALLISKSGTDWTPWTTYKTGAYKAYLAPDVSGAAPSPVLPYPGGRAWLHDPAYIARYQAALAFLARELPDPLLDPRGIDGQCGAYTLAAVMHFQWSAGLDKDGHCGPDTARALDLAVARALPTNPDVKGAANV
jgi:peptidoglycan hydrolase-like protein with peptidoglycan-binding domain